VVAGCAGSGKSTFARQLAARTALPLVERDALGVLGSPSYLATLESLVLEPRWILDGAPYYLDDLVYGTADTVIFLDYPKSVVMWRVLRRTVSVELLRRPSGAHHPGVPSVWRDKTHPLRWAWSSHRSRHEEGLALTNRLADTAFLRFTRPAQTERWLGAV
jgi:hypothetical protein